MLGNLVWNDPVAPTSSDEIGDLIHNLKSSKC